MPRDPNIVAQCIAVAAATHPFSKAMQLSPARLVPAYPAPLVSSLQAVRVFARPVSAGRAFFCALDRASTSRARKADSHVVGWAGWVHDQGRKPLN